MLNVTSNNYRQSVTDSDNNVMQNAYANSSSVKHQRSNLLCCVLLRFKRSVNDTEPIKITGSVVKNIVIYKMNGIRLTCIAQILLRKMQNLAACKAAQIHAHQILSVLHPLVIEHSRSGLSELKILVSVVRFRPRPPSPKRPLVYAIGAFFMPVWEAMRGVGVVVRGLWPWRCLRAP